MSKKLQLNSIYPTYQGEVNVRGIGAPVIFLRLQGCHLRCYKKTLGELCDTPESLERDNEKSLSVEVIVGKVNKVRKETGIDFICLTGGDPLWNDKDELHKLFKLLDKEGYTVSIETSGTISAKDFDYPNLFWVFDYKLKSAGVKIPFNKDNYIMGNSYLKMVIYDKDDLEEALKHTREIVEDNIPITVAVGNYWGGKIPYPQITEAFLKDGLGAHVVFNAQIHKLITHSDNSDVSLTRIPKLL